MWNEIIALYGEYKMPVAYVIAFLVALIYLWRFEKRKELRILFVYVPLVIFLIYFNPWFSEWLQKRSDSEGYNRILWLLPFIMIVGYAIVHAYERMSEKLRGIYACALAVLIVVLGNYMYANPLFSQAENIRYMPESVVHICDAINVPGREVMAVMPKELLQYVRQYSPVTCMPYGVDVLGSEDAWGRDLFEMMEREKLDLKRFSPMSKKYGCHYIVVPAGKELIGNPDDYGLVWFGETDGYAIYRDVTVELVVP